MKKRKWFPTISLEKKEMSHLDVFLISKCWRGHSKIHFTQNIHFKFINSFYNGKNNVYFETNAFQICILLKLTWRMTNILSQYSKTIKKLLRFSKMENLYKLTCLPRGYYHGPGELTKALKPPLSSLILGGVTTTAHLDDCINISHSMTFFWGNSLTESQKCSKALVPKYMENLN